MDDSRSVQVSVPLLEETLEDASVLRFYESTDQPGFISVMIGTSIGAPAPSAVPKSNRVSEIYLAYRPGYEVPSVLVAAQARQDTLRAELRDAPAETALKEAAEPVNDEEAPKQLGDARDAINGVADTEDTYLTWRDWAWALGSKGRWDQRWLNYSSSHTTDNAEGYYAAVVASENGYVSWTMKYRPNLSWKTAWTITAAPGSVWHWFNNSDDNWDYSSKISDVTSGEYFHHAGAYQY